MWRHAVGVDFPSPGSTENKIVSEYVKKGYQDYPEELVRGEHCPASVQLIERKLASIESEFSRLEQQPTRRTIKRRRVQLSFNKTIPEPSFFAKMEDSKSTFVELAHCIPESLIKGSHQASIFSLLDALCNRDMVFARCTWIIKICANHHTNTISSSSSSLPSSRIRGKQTSQAEISSKRRREWTKNIIDYGERLLLSDAIRYDAKKHKKMWTRYARLFLWQMDQGLLSRPMALSRLISTLSSTLSKSRQASGLAPLKHLQLVLPVIASALPEIALSSNLSFRLWNSCSSISSKYENGETDKREEKLQKSLSSHSLAHSPLTSSSPRAHGSTSGHGTGFPHLGVGETPPPSPMTSTPTYGGTYQWSNSTTSLHAPKNPLKALVSSIQNYLRLVYGEMVVSFWENPDTLCLTSPPAISSSTISTNLDGTSNASGSPDGSSARRSKRSAIGLGEAKFIKLLDSSVQAMYDKSSRNPFLNLFVPYLQSRNPASSRWALCLRLLLEWTIADHRRHYPDNQRLGITLALLLEHVGPSKDLSKPTLLDKHIFLFMDSYIPSSIQEVERLTNLARECVRLALTSFTVYLQTLVATGSLPPPNDSSISRSISPQSQFAPRDSGTTALSQSDSLRVKEDDNLKSIPVSQILFPLRVPANLINSQDTSPLGILESKRRRHQWYCFAIPNLQRLSYRMKLQRNVRLLPLRYDVEQGIVRVIFQELIGYFPRPFGTLEVSLRRSSDESKNGDPLKALLVLPSFRPLAQAISRIREERLLAFEKGVLKTNAAMSELSVGCSSLLLSNLPPQVRSMAASHLLSHFLRIMAKPSHTQLLAWQGLQALENIVDIIKNVRLVSSHLPKFLVKILRSPPASVADAPHFPRLIFRIILSNYANLCLSKKTYNIILTWLTSYAIKGKVNDAKRWAVCCGMNRCPLADDLHLKLRRARATPSNTQASTQGESVSRMKNASSGGGNKDAFRLGSQEWKSWLFTFTDKVFQILKSVDKKSAMVGMQDSIDWCKRIVPFSSAQHQIEAIASVMACFTVAGKVFSLGEYPLWLRRHRLRHITSFLDVFLSPNMVCAGRLLSPQAIQSLVKCLLAPSNSQSPSVPNPTSTPTSIPITTTASISMIIPPLSQAESIISSYHQKYQSHESIVSNDDEHVTIIACVQMICAGIPGVLPAMLSLLRTQDESKGHTVVSRLACACTGYCIQKDSVALGSTLPRKAREILVATERKRWTEMCSLLLAKGWLRALPVGLLGLFDSLADTLGPVISKIPKIGQERILNAVLRPPIFQPCDYMIISREYTNRSLEQQAEKEKEKRSPPLDSPSDVLNSHPQIFNFESQWDLQRLCVHATIGERCTGKAGGANRDQWKMLDPLLDAMQRTLMHREEDMEVETKAISPTTRSVSSQTVPALTIEKAVLCLTQVRGLGTHFFNRLLSLLSAQQKALASGISSMNVGYSTDDEITHRLVPPGSFSQFEQVSIRSVDAIAQLTHASALSLSADAIIKLIDLLEMLLNTLNMKNPQPAQSTGIQSMQTQTTNRPSPTPNTPLTPHTPHTPHTPLTPTTPLSPSPPPSPHPYTNETAKILILCPKAIEAATQSVLAHISAAAGLLLQLGRSNVTSDVASRILTTCVKLICLQIVRASKDQHSLDRLFLLLHAMSRDWGNDNKIMDAVRKTASKADDIRGRLLQMLYTKDGALHLMTDPVTKAFKSQAQAQKVLKKRQRFGAGLTASLESKKSLDPWMVLEGISRSGKQAKFPVEKVSFSRDTRVPPRGM